MDWKTYTWIQRLNIGKIQILPKLIYRFTATPIKNLSRIVLYIHIRLS